MSSKSVGFSPSSLANLSAAEKVGSLDPRLSRTDYFDGRLLTATDLIRDQTYLDERVLEVGRALGSGVVRGLEVELVEQRYLRVNPGLAITAGGRVLEVSEAKPLEIDLHNRALLIQLNNRTQLRFSRGLYAVTLQYVELGSHASEAYPIDPLDQSEFEYDSFVEGAEVTLTPLRLELPSDDELSARASLAVTLLRNPGQPAEVDQQAISLALLAINNGEPQWLDIHLLRRPLRPEHLPSVWQADLYRHYLELLDGVLSRRAESGQSERFAASQHFQLLPPAGVLPLAAVNPANAVQYFFPQNYQISLAPVRLQDLPSLQAESMPLAPFDLNSSDSAEIMILAPLSDSQFNQHARRLGFSAELLELPGDNPQNLSLSSSNPWLHATDLLQLRLSRLPQRIDPRATTVWNDIWQLLTQGDGLLHYVRRPARAAETQVSAVVLAHGFQIPPPSGGLQEQIDALNSQLAQLQMELDNNSSALSAAQAMSQALQQQLAQANSLADSQSAQIAQLQTSITTLTAQRNSLTAQLNTTQTQLGSCQAELEKCLTQGGGSGGFSFADNIDLVLDMRAVTDPAVRRIAQTLMVEFIRDPNDLITIEAITKRINPAFDPVLWSTLTSVMQTGTLKLFDEITLQSATDPLALAKGITANADRFKLDRVTVDGWNNMATRLGG